MPIVAGDLEIRYSIKTGTAGNQASGNAAGSLGKYVATNEITTAELNNWMDHGGGYLLVPAPWTSISIFAESGNLAAGSMLSIEGVLQER